MIYRFIDNNGSEIAVNSLSSLQALVESETIKEDTKIKAGLRGKWTTASKINELVFPKEEIPEPSEPEEDIKSFITKEEPKEEIKEEPKEEIKEEPKEEIKEEIKTKELEQSVNKNTEKDSDIKSNEKQDENTLDTSDYYTEVFMKKDNDKNVSESQEEDVVENDDDNDMKNKKKNKYDNKNVIGLKFFQAIGMCFNKYFTIDGRASRSEYWYWYLFIFIIGLIVDYFDAALAGVPWMEYEVYYGPLSIILTIITLLPGLAVAIRRLHDVNKSGWWLLISLTIIGIIPLIVWAASKGTEGKNKFGNYPLKLKKKS